MPKSALIKLKFVKIKSEAIKFKAHLIFKCALYLKFQTRKNQKSLNLSALNDEIPPKP
ncbi:hypothetical protein CINF_0812 [Candidatus Campylobacter infans]|uniref:Uncharacterized protein n=1 Tax=Candidatus Campylobacter infans TaxID=2561898 RepID=A0A7H9CGR0_9BACT|nr:hypothetical protein CINF_0812 [Candidatus Campylobacter infans]